MMDGPGCGHDNWYTDSITYGDYIGTGPRRWQEMEHIVKCRICGEEATRQDRYTGDDREPGYVVIFDKRGHPLWRG
jgi:hypothetical protein